MRERDNDLHLVQPHRADGDDDSASRSYKSVHQSDVLNKLRSTLKISAKTVSKMCCAVVGCQLSSHTVWKRSTCNQVPKNTLGSYFDCY